jgi:hypothetical protein
MKNMQEPDKSGKNIKLAVVFGLIALAWYIASMTVMLWK